MNLRMTITAAAACLLASFSLTSVIAGNGWLGAGAGAVIVAAAAGILTRTRSTAATVSATFLVLIAVVPLLTGWGWAARIGGLAIVAAVAIGLAPPPAAAGAAVLATYLASLLIYFSLLFAARASFGWVIPSRGTMAASARSSAARSTISGTPRRYRHPRCHPRRRRRGWGSPRCWWTSWPSGCGGLPSPDCRCCCCSASRSRPT